MKHFYINKLPSRKTEKQSRAKPEKSGMEIEIDLFYLYFCFQCYNNHSSLKRSVNRRKKK